MHPIHSRRTGAGVSAAVGTELGSYSTARSATDERKKDRDALFGNGGSSRDDAFERAAAMGVSDASAFSHIGDKHVNTRTSGQAKTEAKNSSTQAPSPTSNYMSQLQRYEGSAELYVELPIRLLS
jgi:hypothetical protein